MEIMISSEKSSEVVNITRSYLKEAEFARQDRMRLNELNFNCYHMRQDYSHKLRGQSKEFVGKQSMAVEQLSSFAQQGLVDVGEWFGMEFQAGMNSDTVPISADEAKSILMNDLDQCSFMSFVGDSVKLGLLQSLMIAKVHGKMESRFSFYVETKEDGGTFKNVLKRAEKKYWKPVLETLRAEDWYIDPSGKGLYRIQRISMDFHDVKKMSEGKDAIYTKSAVDQLGAGYAEADLQAAKKSQETGQNQTWSYSRKQVKIHECWGTIVDNIGNVLYENVTWTIAEDNILISPPKPFPFWHGKVPYVSSPFIRVPNSEWHKALMDGPTASNGAINELYNLMVDDGMNSVHGIKQVRTDWLEDDSQVSNGLYPGITLKVNSQAPVGAKVIEVVPTNGMSSETMNVYQMMCAEFSAMALTNDLRMGVMPNRAVKATEVVEASQSITGVMTGISKVIEEDYVEPILYQMWSNRLQHMDQTYLPDLISLVGEARASAIMAIPKEQLFAQCVDGYKFKVFGISRVLSKQKDFKKIVALIQTLSADPVLMEEFNKEYSSSKLLSEFMKSLDINIDAVKLSKEEIAQQQAQQQQSLMQNAGAPGGSQSGQGPDMQSQIPQASAQESAESTESLIPKANMSGLAGKAQGGSH